VLWRRAAKEKKNNTWIVLDGPVVRAFPNHHVPPP
jgi:hypothetical protein